MIFLAEYKTNSYYLSVDVIAGSDVLYLHFKQEFLISSSNVTHYVNVAPKCPVTEPSHMETIPDFFNKKDFLEKLYKSKVFVSISLPLFNKFVSMQIGRVKVASE